MERVVWVVMQWLADLVRRPIQVKYATSIKVHFAALPKVILDVKAQ